MEEIEVFSAEAFLHEMKLETKKMQPANAAGVTPGPHELSHQLKANSGFLESSELSFAIVYLQSLCRGVVPTSLRQRIGESDLVQETLLGATKSIGQFRGKSIESFRAWLREIFQNRLNNLVREHIVCQKRSVRREEWSVTEGNTEGDNSLNCLAEKELDDLEHQLMHSTFQELPKNDQRIIELHARQGLQFALIASILGQSEPTVRKRYLRAIRRWRVLVQRANIERA